MAQSVYILRQSDDADLGAITSTGSITATSGFKQTTTAYAANGAIAIPSGSNVAVLTKAGVNAMTLAAPTSGTHDGVVLTIIAATANAHTVTYTAGFNGGGASTDVATFGGAKGDNLTVIAYSGVWYVQSSVGITLA